MKVLQWILPLFLFSSAQCAVLKTQELIDAIEQSDPIEVVNFFERASEVTLSEAQEFVADLYDYFISKYGSEILDDDEYIQNIEYCHNHFQAALNNTDNSGHNWFMKSDPPPDRYLLLCADRKGKNQTNTQKLRSQNL